MVYYYLFRITVVLFSLTQNYNNFNTILLLKMI